MTGGATARSSSVFAHTPRHVAAWLKAIINATQDVQDAIVREEVDGAVMQQAVAEGDRGTLAELGITKRLQQTKVFARWKASGKQ